MFLASMHLDILTPALEGEWKGLRLPSCLLTLVRALVLSRGCRNRPNSSKRCMSVSTTMPLTACRETNALVKRFPCGPPQRASERIRRTRTGVSIKCCRGSAFWATLIK